MLLARYIPLFILSPPTLLWSFIIRPQGLKISCARLIKLLFFHLSLWTCWVTLPFKNFAFERQVLECPISLIYSMKSENLTLKSAAPLAHHFFWRATFLTHHAFKPLENWPPHFLVPHFLESLYFINNSFSPTTFLRPPLYDRPFNDCHIFRLPRFTTTLNS